MKRSMTFIIAVFAILVSALGGNQAQAQNELLSKGQSGFGVWRGQFTTESFGFGVIGLGVGVSDIIEISFQSTLGNRVDEEGTFTFALHTPTPRKPTTVGLAAMVSFSESTGVGGAFYLRAEASPTVVVVPMMSVMHYTGIKTRSYWGRISEKSATAIAIGGHLAFKISKTTMLTITPQHTSWGAGDRNNSYGASVGLLFLVE